MSSVSTDADPDKSSYLTALVYEEDVDRKQSKFERSRSYNKIGSKKEKKADVSGDAKEARISTPVVGTPQKRDKSSRKERDLSRKLSRDESFGISDACCWASDAGLAENRRAIDSRQAAECFLRDDLVGSHVKMINWEPLFSSVFNNGEMVSMESLAHAAGTSGGMSSSPLALTQSFSGFSARRSSSATPSSIVLRNSTRSSICDVSRTPRSSDPGLMSSLSRVSLRGSSPYHVNHTPFQTSHSSTPPSTSSLSPFHGPCGTLSVEDSPPTSQPTLLPAATLTPSATATPEKASQSCISPTTSVGTSVATGFSAGCTSKSIEASVPLSSGEVQEPVFQAHRRSHSAGPGFAKSPFQEFTVSKADKKRSAKGVVPPKAVDATSVPGPRKFGRSVSLRDSAKSNGPDKVTDLPIGLTVRQVPNRFSALVIEDEGATDENEAVDSRKKSQKADRRKRKKDKLRANKSFDAEQHDSFDCDSVSMGIRSVKSTGSLTTRSSTPSTCMNLPMVPEEGSRELPTPFGSPNQSALMLNTGDSLYTSNLVVKPRDSNDMWTPTPKTLYPLAPFPRTFPGTEYTSKKVSSTEFPAEDAPTPASRRAIIAQSKPVASVEKGFDLFNGPEPEFATPFLHPALTEAGNIFKGPENAKLPEPLDKANRVPGFSGFMMSTELKPVDQIVERANDVAGFCGFAVANDQAAEKSPRKSTSNVPGCGGQDEASQSVSKQDSFPVMDSRPSIPNVPGVNSRRKMAATRHDPQAKRPCNTQHLVEHSNQFEVLQLQSSSQLRSYSSKSASGLSPIESPGEERFVTCGSGQVSQSELLRTMSSQRFSDAVEHHSWANLPAAQSGDDQVETARKSSTPEDTMSSASLTQPSRASLDLVQSTLAPVATRPLDTQPSLPLGETYGYIHSPIQPTAGTVVPAGATRVPSRIVHGSKSSALPGWNYSGSTMEGKLGLRKRQVRRVEPIRMQSLQGSDGGRMKIVLNPQHSLDTSPSKMPRSSAQKWVLPAPVTQVTALQLYQGVTSVAQGVRTGILDTMSKLLCGTGQASSELSECDPKERRERKQLDGCIPDDEVDSDGDVLVGRPRAWLLKQHAQDAKHHAQLHQDAWEEDESSSGKFNKDVFLTSTGLRNRRTGESENNRVMNSAGSRLVKRGVGSGGRDKRESCIMCKDMLLRQNFVKHEKSLVFHYCKVCDKLYRQAVAQLGCAYDPVQLSMYRQDGRLHELMPGVDVYAMCKRMYVGETLCTLPSLRALCARLDIDPDDIDSLCTHQPHRGKRKASKGHTTSVMTSPRHDMKPPRHDMKPQEGGAPHYRHASSDFDVSDRPAKSPRIPMDVGAILGSQESRYRHTPAKLIPKANTHSWAAVVGQGSIHHSDGSTGVRSKPASDCSSFQAHGSLLPQQESSRRPVIPTAPAIINAGSAPEGSSFLGTSPAVSLPIKHSQLSSLLEAPNEVPPPPPPPPVMRTLSEATEDASRGEREPRRHHRKPQITSPKKRAVFAKNAISGCTTHRHHRHHADYLRSRSVQGHRHPAGLKTTVKQPGHRRTASSHPPHLRNPYPANNEPHAPLTYASGCDTSSVLAAEEALVSKRVQAWLRELESSSIPSHKRHSRSTAVDINFEAPFVSSSAAKYHTIGSNRVQSEVASVRGSSWLTKASAMQSSPANTSKLGTQLVSQLSFGSKSLNAALNAPITYRDALKVMPLSARPVGHEQSVSALPPPLDVNPFVTTTQYAVLSATHGGPSIFSPPDVKPVPSNATAGEPNPFDPTPFAGPTTHAPLPARSTFHSPPRTPKHRPPRTLTSSTHTRHIDQPSSPQNPFAGGTELDPCSPVLGNPFGGVPFDEQYSAQSSGTRNPSSGHEYPDDGEECRAAKPPFFQALDDHHKLPLLSLPVQANSGHETPNPFAMGLPDQTARNQQVFTRVQSSPTESQNLASVANDLTDRIISEQQKPIFSMWGLSFDEKCVVLDTQIEELWNKVDDAADTRDEGLTHAATELLMGLTRKCARLEMGTASPSEPSDSNDESDSSDLSADLVVPRCGSTAEELHECQNQLVLFPNVHDDSLLKRLESLASVLPTGNIPPKERMSTALELLDRLWDISKQTRTRFLLKTKLRMSAGKVGFDPPVCAYMVVAVFRQLHETAEYMFGRLICSIPIEQLDQNGSVSSDGSTSDIPLIKVAQQYIEFSSTIMDWCLGFVDQIANHLLKADALCLSVSPNMNKVGWFFDHCENEKSVWAKLLCDINIAFVVGLDNGASRMQRTKAMMGSLGDDYPPEVLKQWSALANTLQKKLLKMQFTSCVDYLIAMRNGFYNLKTGLSHADKKKITLTDTVKHEIAGRYNLGVGRQGALDFNAQVKNFRWLVQMMQSSNQCIIRVMEAIQQAPSDQVDRDTGKRSQQSDSQSKLARLFGETCFYLDNAVVAFPHILDIMCIHLRNPWRRKKVVRVGGQTVVQMMYRMRKGHPQPLYQESVEKLEKILSFLNNCVSELRSAYLRQRVVISGTTKGNVHQLTSEQFARYSARLNASLNAVTEHCETILRHPERVASIRTASQADGASTIGSDRGDLQSRYSDDVYNQEADWVTVGQKVYKKFKESTCGITTVHDLPLCSENGKRTLVAVKWIHLREVRGNLLNMTEINHTLTSEIAALCRLRNSMTPQDRFRSNVVHFVGITSNSMLHETYIDLFKGNAVTLDTGTKVGIVMQYLPNGSLHQLLQSAAQNPNALTFGQAMASHPDQKLPELPAKSLSEKVATFLTMPVNQLAVDDVHLQWLQAVIPPADPSTTDTRPCNSRTRRDSEGCFSNPDVLFHPDHAKTRTAWVPQLLILTSWRYVLQIMIGCARGLAQCHYVGLLHRDLEPWNILFDKYGRPTIIDFGFAKKLSKAEGGSGLERSLHPLHHAIYMAPEARGQQHRSGNKLAVDWMAGDVWALSMILWELATLRSLMGEQYTMEVQVSRLREELKSVGDELACQEEQYKDQFGDDYFRPPLPSAKFVRPAFFAPGPDRAKQMMSWCEDTEAGGWRRLRSIIHSCQTLRPEKRSTARSVVDELKTLLADYPLLL